MEKKLGLSALTALVLSSMLGAGVFSLPQNMAAVASPAALLIGWGITGAGILLLAFAMLYPEVQVLLFFVISIRVKYFGFFAAILWVLSFLGAPLPQKLSLLLSMANVWLFFGPMGYRAIRAWVRREQWKRKNRR